MGHGSASDGDFAEARALISPDMMYAPEKGTYTSAAAASNSDRVSSLQAEFEAARGEMSKEAARAAKLEKKVAILTGGLQARQTKLVNGLEEAYAVYESTKAESACYLALRESETRSAPMRLEKLQDQLKHCLERERDLQKQFKELSDEKALLLRGTQA